MHLSTLIHKKSYEHVLYVLRRHPFTFLPRALFALTLLILPMVLIVLMRRLFPELFVSAIFFPIITLASSLYTLFVLLLLYTEFTDYYLDLWIITNDRIIDIEQFGLFSRTISEIDLFRLQDVTTEVKGFFATFLNYGTVTVTTASTNPDLVFRNIRDPNKIRNELIRLSHEDRKYHQTQLEN